jgi:hypothetical protein
MRLDDVRGVVRPDRRSRADVAWPTPSLPGQIFAPPTAGEDAASRESGADRDPARHTVLGPTRWLTALVSTPAPTASAPVDHAARRRRVLALMMVIGAAAAIITGVLGGWGYAPVVGWSAAALTFCSLTWVDTRNRDADQDGGNGGARRPVAHGNRPSHFHCEWGESGRRGLRARTGQLGARRDAGAAGRGWRSPVWRSRRH